MLQTNWAKSEAIAGRPVLELQHWNPYWLRHIAHGRECYQTAAKNKSELVLIQELLVQLRCQNIDLEAAALNLAIQPQPNLAKNVAMKGLAYHLVREVSKLAPSTPDPESQDKIRAVEQQVAKLTQQVQGSPSITCTSLGFSR